MTHITATPASVEAARQEFVHALADAYLAALRQEFAGQPGRIAGAIARAGSAADVRQILVDDFECMLARIARQAADAGL